MIAAISNDWTATAETNVGKVRKLNEDAVLDLSEQSLWVVADGMGGHAAGDIASQMIADRIKNYQRTELFGHNIKDIVNRLCQVNDDLTEYALTKGLGIIGSTVAVLLMDKHYCATIWAGDSRVYRLRNNRLRQLTVDHDQVREFMRMGISEEKALAMPGSEVITRAIGSDEVHLPQVNLHQHFPGDKYLLCSDGLTKELSDETIEGAMAAFEKNKIVEVLMRKALEEGARDNVSIISVESN